MNYVRSVLYEVQYAYWNLRRKIQYDYLPGYRPVNLKNYIRHKREQVPVVPRRTKDCPKALEKWYQKPMGYSFSLDDPKTFNEKINWLKLYDSTPLKGRLADKYLVNPWIEERIGKEYLIPIIGVWDTPNKIDFNSLPDQFVLKITNGSGRVVIVKDKNKINKKAVIGNLAYWQRYDFAGSCFEMHYRYCEPRIIAQPYIEGLANRTMLEYKVHCFNDGAPVIWAVRNALGDENRADSIVGEPDYQIETPYSSYFDEDWNYLFKEKKHNRLDCPPPKNLKKMLAFSKKLAEGFPTVRVDWYEVDGQLYFGEMTFTHNAGLDVYDPVSIDEELGQRIDLTRLKAWKILHQ
ncbi:MAG: hypothetical protein J6D18_04350 [Erysipelotrichaceae bacterium]|nr:hypothetical protein [Erysipelotrichaceae bacterium]